MNYTPQKVDLSRIKSCNQYWSEMEQCGQEKICAKCSHVIHDFRKKTPFEIAYQHANSSTKVCGIYSKEQLNPRTPKPKRLKVWATALISGISYLISQKAVAHTTIAKTKIECPIDTKQVDTEQYLTQKTEQESDSILIQGKISLQEGDSLTDGTFVNVMVKNSKIWCSADVEGKYSLTIPKSAITSDSIPLLFSYIGFATKEILTNAKQDQNIDIILSQGIHITEFYVHYKPPLHKRIWYFIQRPFR